MITVILIVVFLCCLSPAMGFRSTKVHTLNKKRFTMATEHVDTLITLHQHFIDASSVPVWAQYAAQGIAEAPPVCPGFGEPGWAPLCFLRGNPVFNTFDQFQLFIQNSVVSLHDVIQGTGVKNAYGPSIVLFTVGIRTLLFPLLYTQLKSTEKTRALQPKITEIKEKYPNDQNLQNQLTALLYQESEVNPLAGCLPAIIQIPVFIALYRSFQNLATKNLLNEPFLWLPDLEGPVYGTRSTSWLFGQWHDMSPPLGWSATLSFLVLPLLLTAVQTLSIRLSSPPSDDPAIQKTQRILKYLPFVLGYFSLSFPAGLGVYYLTNSVLATGSTLGIREYFKQNPSKFDIDIDKLANDQYSAFRNPVWGYENQAQTFDEARLNLRPSRKPRIPADFV